VAGPGAFFVASEETGFGSWFASAHLGRFALKFLNVKFLDRIGDGRHLAELPAQAIRTTRMLLIQDQLGNTFDYNPGFYVAHSASHPTLIFSIRSLGKVPLVSTARLNINRKLRGAPSGSGLAKRAAVRSSSSAVMRFTVGSVWQEVNDLVNA